MIAYKFTLVGIAAVIAAIASLFTALAQVWNNRKLTKVEQDVKVVKQNGHGEGGGADGGSG